MPLPMELFPYPEVRPFQDELMQVVFTADIMLASVPTGAGKSIASLCGFLADRMEGERVVVLTRTKSQAEIFLREARAIAGRAGRLLAVHLHSKQDLCPLFRDEETSYEEFLELCRLSRCGYRELFRRRIHEIEELAERLETPPAGERLLAYGCPHAVLLELARHADVVIASYPYLLSPALRTSFLSRLGVDMEQLLVIVDEAHNLHAQEGRSLSRRTVELALRESGGEVLEALLEHFSGRDSLLTPSELVSHAEAEALYRAGVEQLRRKLKKGRKISHTYRVAIFLKSALAAEGEENWLFFRQAQKLHLKPLFPAEHLKPLRRARKLLLMSGTLEPLEMYREMFGFENAELYSCPSLYSRNVLYLALRSGLSTAMSERERRGEELWKSYAEAIEKIHLATPSTTLVFFPSYSIMHSVGRYLRSPLMEPRDARKLGEFMQQVMSMRSKLVLGVAGGKLSEGVEYTLPSPEGRRSIVGSVVIAGLPFPVPDFEFELRRKLYEERYSPARAYAYLLLVPMLNRVLQSAGRAVRSARDRACVVFLDERLEHLRHLPEHIRHELTPLELEELVDEVRWFHTER